MHNKAYSIEQTRTTPYINELAPDLITKSGAFNLSLLPNILFGLSFPNLKQ